MRVTAETKTATRVNIVRTAKKLCTLGETAVKDMHSRIGVNFSGLALYVNPIACPECGIEIDPTQFVVASESNAEDDYE